MAEAEQMSVADATRALLLAIRLRAVAEMDVIESTLASMSLTVDGPETLVGRLEIAGLVEHREGGHPGWRLTPDGRSEGERLLGVELDERGVRAEVTSAYERFVAINGALLRACTDWQLLDANPSAPVVNDHANAAYDAAVIERLTAVHASVRPICDDLTAALARFGTYPQRLGGAMDRINAGDVAAVDEPDTDSYHAIWFELHDHLLATTGRDRSAEPLPDAAYRPPAD